jgi:hypothetical protein
MPTIPSLSLTIKPATALYSSIVSDANISAHTSTQEGRTGIVLDFTAGNELDARDLGMIFSWPASSGTILFNWQPSLVDLPEMTYDRATDWDSGGAPGDKFVQGIVIEADSFNAAKTFFLQSSDDLSMHTLLECPATFNKQSEKSFSCVPFISHSVRLVSTDGVPWRVWGSRLVFKPFPPATLNWTTELSSLGMIGWGHIREINLAYVSTAAVTLVLTFDYWPPITITFPSSAGAQAKVVMPIPPNKFKLVSFTATSSAPVRIFEPDLQVKIGQWGRADSYKVVRPFGGAASSGAEL